MACFAWSCFFEFIQFVQIQFFDVLIMDNVSVLGIYQNPSIRDVSSVEVAVLRNSRRPCVDQRLDFS